MKNIAEEIIREIQEQENIKAISTPDKDLFKPNKNNFVKYMMQQLKSYCLIQQKVKSLSEEICQIEKYGLSKKSKGILLYERYTNYSDNLSDFEKKERVLEYLKAEYKRLYPIYDAYALRFLIYECYDCFDIWRLREIEGMTEKEIKSFYNILGKEAKYTPKQAEQELKKRIMLEDEEIFNCFGIQ